MLRSRLLLGSLAAAFALASGPFFHVGRGTAFAGPYAATDARVARGLDLFLHAPDRGAPGATLPVQVLALGFPTVVTLRPLEAVTVEATWDPEHLGKVSAAPPPVRVTTDAQGRAHLDVPIPDGPERKLKLLVGVRVGDRQRTQALEVQRTQAHEVAIRVPEQEVVPGGALSAWVTVESAATGLPAGGAKVELALLEGGIARHTAVLTADAAGVAMGRVPIPWTDEPAWSWTLRARSLAHGGDAGATSITLAPREETPGQPEMVVRWKEADLRAGDRAEYVLRVRDGAGLPVANLPVRIWVGPKGTSPPEDKDEWIKASTAARTDAQGEVRGATTAPTTVVEGVGTELRVVARAEFEGFELKDHAVVDVGNPSSTAALLPEAGAIVPGVEQRVLLRVLDGRWDPVQGSFTVEGDGLKASVTTDAHGEAEVIWKPPVDVGALRNVGPCAGGVAAAVLVRPVGAIPALGPRREAFQLCLSVDREAGALLRTERAMVRAGDQAALRLLEAGQGSGPAGWSVMVRSANAGRGASAWIDGGAGAIALPEGSAGVWSLSAAAPRIQGKARAAAGAVLVAPRVLPALSAKVAGGRPTPGGEVEVELALSGKDASGASRGLPGTIAAVVVDLHGGGSVSGLELLDTRSRLCGAIGVEQERCEPFLDGDPALEPLRRALLGERRRAAAEPANDPAGTAPEALRKAFGEVLRSLEGAVFEASGDPDRLLDVRRKAPGGGLQWNPELMTLVTAAMGEPPRTPGGEPLALPDLLAVDPQVTFDNVARRITRLKLFRILAALRELRHEKQLDADEPALRDPGALLRRAVRDGKVSEDLLLDPWGGTIQFVKTAAPPAPFLTVARGFALQAPGPDGRIGTGDDVRDPFERVLRSGTPYADALGEDQIVDARFDMEVGEATVSSWQTLFESNTGTALGLGSIGTLGHGSGTGTGYGYGSGHGRLGGSHRSRGSRGIMSGVYFWSPPQRTDADGKLRMKVPLGDAETTWRIAFVGVPDRGTAATTRVDVATSLPLSARVDAGAAWIEGDEVEVEISVRNRSAKAARAALAIEARGAAALADPRGGAAVVDVPAGGAAPVRVRVRAPRAGRAELTAKVSAPGLEPDVVSHAWEVRPAGERTDLSASQWVEAGAPATLRAPALGKVYALTGQPRLLLERGLGGALSAALESMEPDRLASPGALADAVEVASRIRRWATARQGEASPLATRAVEVARRAVGRLVAYKAGKKELVFWDAERRARAFAPADLGGDLAGEKASCPQGPLPLEKAIEVLEHEPAPEGGAAAACWDSVVTGAVDEASVRGDAVAMARALLSLAERPHRAAAAVSLANALRDLVKLRASGGISLSPGLAADRASRALVYAALLRAAPLGKSAAPAGPLLGWLGVQRDAYGGYGTALATRSAVRALLSHEGADDRGTSKVTVTSGGAPREVEVGPEGRVVVALDPAAVEATLSVVGPGVVARLERPALRRWASPPDTQQSPVQIEVTWPKQPRAGAVGKLLVSLGNKLDRGVAVDARIPLPPGVTLAAPVSGVRQVQGTLVVRIDRPADRIAPHLEIPLRFALAGRVTVPEARARVALEELPRAVAPARALVVGR